MPQRSKLLRPPVGLSPGMGQSASSSAPYRKSLSRQYRARSTSMSTTRITIEDHLPPVPENRVSDVVDRDYISDIPDECLACIFQSLGSGDRKKCSLVCRRWLRVEGQSRHRLSLDARCEILGAIPGLFSRFEAVSKLALRCDRRSVSVGDEALLLISLRCQNLTRFKLRGCRQLTDAGVAAFAKNSKRLKKLSCGSCAFGAKGMNAILDHCADLEEISIKRLRGIEHWSAKDPIGPGAAARSLKTICLKDLYNGQSFGPLVIGSKNLKTLKLLRCAGEWDNLLGAIFDQNSGLTEIHLERLQLSDSGLDAVSNNSGLEIFHLVKTPGCTSDGLVSISNGCRLLRKVHIDGWRLNRIGDEALIGLAKHCPKLQELVLIGVNPTSLSLGLIARDCLNLERLALCGNETIGDEEISCIAAKSVALKKLCIKGCPITDHGVEALACGCPNLVKVKIKKCRGITREGVDWLMANRKALAVNLEISAEQPDGNASDDVGVQENDGDPFQTVVDEIPAVDLPSTTNSSRRAALLRLRMGFLAGRNFVTSSFNRWSHRYNNPHNI